MKKLLFSILGILLFITGYNQSKYWQQEANFTINATLNDNDHTLDAFETIEYINHSPDTLSFIWFHLWPNAYKNDKTAFSEQTLKNGSTDFYFSGPGKKGYINRLNFKADNIAARIEQDDNNIDIVKLLLPSPLPPGKKTIITTPFHVKLPHNFSRGGHTGNDYQVTQWFPKPAVYDSKGWHTMPYLDQGEFYSEFGSFDVEINLPGEYLVAATGILQDKETLEQIKKAGKHTATPNRKIWNFKQSNIHDFAWFASKDYIAQYDTVRLPSNKVVDIFSYYTPGKHDGWKESTRYAKEGIRKYSEWIGDYPYTVASIVQGSRNENSGGMEYPTITLITTQATGQELDATITHELGHNWFYAALANNERKHAWLDEGINTFYQKRYEAEKYGSNAYLKMMPSWLKNKVPDDPEDILLRTLEKMKKDQPIETPSEQFSAINYGMITYFKASRWLKQMEEEVGRENLDKAMQEYYAGWKFKHPYPEDFKASLERSTKTSLDSFFRQLHTTGEPVSNEEKRTTKASFFFNLRDTKKYNYINIIPGVGYNNYDKLMPGLLVHNYQLPFNKFQFIAGAVIGTGSGKIQPLGRASYTIYKKRFKIEPAVSLVSFSTNEFVSGNEKVITGVKRITPSIKLTAFNKDATNSSRFTAQWKTFLIKEEELDFRQEITGNDTIETVGTAALHNTVNRLSLSISDGRVLYPYHFNFTAEQGKSFLRTTFTAKYYFNYPDGKNGLQARLFAGKFFYLKEKTSLESIRNDRYFLNMSGPTGYEDYTYSNYFLGRREFSGFMSQQIMERDGFFKVKSDILSNEIGKTDDWLVSLNLVSDIPDNLNPLSVLPFKIPLKIFADAGTYANAGKLNNGAGRFLYDAGLQVSLFGSVVNVYVPLIYSKVYRDLFKSTISEKRFIKNIAFTINLEKLKPSALSNYLFL